MPSYVKTGSKQALGGESNKLVVDKEENEFLTQLKESSTKPDIGAGGDKTKKASG